MTCGRSVSPFPPGPSSPFDLQLPHTEYRSPVLAKTSSSLYPSPFPFSLQSSFARSMEDVVRALVEDTGRLERRGRAQGAALEQHRWAGVCRGGCREGKISALGTMNLTGHLDGELAWRRKAV